MQTTTRRLTICGIAAASVLPALARAQEGASYKGTILSRNGNRILMRSGTGEAKVRMMDSTKVLSSAGVLGVRRNERYPNELIAGLPIEVKGHMQGDEIVADEILFNPNDLKTAHQIQAGLHGTEERLASVGELAAVGQKSVYFPVGKSALSPKAKEDLQAIAAQAKAHKGYRLAVVGRADPTGSAAANQRLSEARAAAVTAYLIQSCGVLPSSLLPAAAVGESPVFQDPNPPKSDADARRVTVTIAVSKANMPPG